MPGSDRWAEQVVESALEAGGGKPFNPSEERERLQRFADRQASFSGWKNKTSAVGRSLTLDIINEWEAESKRRADFGKQMQTVYKEMRL